MYTYLLEELEALLLVDLTADLKIKQNKIQVLVYFWNRDVIKCFYVECTWIFTSWKRSFLPCKFYWLLVDVRVLLVSTVYCSSGWKVPYSLLKLCKHTTCVNWSQDCSFLIRLLSFWWVLQSRQKGSPCPYCQLTLPSYRPHAWGFHKKSHKVFKEIQIKVVKSHSNYLQHSKAS